MPRIVLLRITRKWEAKRGGASAGSLGWQDRAEVLISFCFFLLSFYLLFGDNFGAVKLAT